MNYYNYFYTFFYKHKVYKHDKAQTSLKAKNFFSMTEGSGDNTSNSV